jgi:hypothetical protein
MERLGAQDLSMVLPEDFGWPQDIGAVGILDGSGLLGPDGRFPIGAVREQISRRLHYLPPFRQLLYTPRRGLGWPLWVDAPAFDIADHVKMFPHAIPVGEAQLLAACEELRRRRLDRSRPLWQMWFLPGLAEARMALFMKVHHAIADGVAGVAAFGTFLDVSADAPAPYPPPWTPAPFPTGRELFDDNLRRRIHGCQGLVSGLTHPARTVRGIRQAWPAAREAIAHAHHATVNDVLLAAVAGGLRNLLASRGERVGELVLRAFVPVSLHREQPGQARGNLDGAMIVPLPVGEPGDARKLQLIAADTAERKKKSRPAGSTFFRNAAIQRAFLRYATRQRLMNVYLANIPGPPVPLYLAGAPLAEVFPVVPILGNVSLGIGALSYAGQFNITVVADRDSCPDAGVFVAGLRASLDELSQPAALPS